MADPAVGGPSVPQKRKAEKGPDEFSSQVRRRLEKSTRTGQACDRCKVRKIKCDATPGGCTPCRLNNVECKTIDRITGKATSRGHQDRLEDEIRLLRQRCNDYSEQLRGLGVDVPPVDITPTYHQSQPHTSQSWSASATPWLETSHQALPAGLSNSTSSLFLQALPAFRNGAPGDNYLGVSSTNSALSPITGTSMHFFGLKIDVADFAPNETEDISSPASYQYFVATILRQHPDGLYNIEPSIPSTEEEMKMFANMFFRSLNPYMPVLHQPSFMYIITRMYGDPAYKPSKAEKVMVHMVLAKMKYHIGLRNDNKASTDDSTRHWTWSLGQYYAMHTHHKLEDVQAMALVAIHLRNYSKPGAALSMVRRVMDMCLELGLHRSAKAWNDESKMGPRELEARKRVFWTVHTLHTHISGKLGRPMPLRMEDVDIEFPEPVNDNLPDESPNCSILVGIACVKITALLSQMYSTIYSVRRDPSMHESIVKRLEELLAEWKSEIPQELRSHDKQYDERRVYALYIQFWEAEFSLLLHHPAICLSADPQWIAHDASVCLLAADNMLRIVDQLRQLNSLDFPWINVTIYLAALFTTLYVQASRTEPIRTIEMEKLRSDMNTWLEIMGEIGGKLGSGDRLRDTIRPIIDQSLQSISHRVHFNKPSMKPVDQNAALVAAAIATEANRFSQEQQQAEQQSTQATNGLPVSVGMSDLIEQIESGDNKSARRNSYVPVQPSTMSQRNTFSSTPNGYAYPDPAVVTGSNPTYGDANGTNTVAQAFAAERGYVPAATVALAAQASTGTTNTGVAPLQSTEDQAPAQQQPGFELYQQAVGQTPQPVMASVAASAAAAAANAALYGMGNLNGGQHPQLDWLRWAQGLSSAPGQEYLSGANTLMALRGTEAGTTPSNASTSQQISQHGQWPQMLFEISGTSQAANSILGPSSSESQNATLS